MEKVLRIAQKAIIITEHSLLTVKYIKAPYSLKNIEGKFGLPGGQMDFGEEPDESLLREVFEETGVIVKPMQPINIWSWTYINKVLKNK